jgi:hypothetical protein
MMLDRILGSPLAWTGARLPAGAGRVTLDDACLAELDAAAVLLRANPRPTLALRPGDFRLDACHHLMNHVKEALEGRHDDLRRPRHRPGAGQRRPP